MNTSKKLQQTDIWRNCSSNAYNRGADYYSQGRVLSVKVVSEGALFVQLSASVKGHDVIPYKQNIRVTWRSDYSSATIDGNCSCPVGYNCKHIAAVCLSYQQSLEQNTGTASYLTWLNSLDEPVGQSDTEHPEFIAYLLKLNEDSNELLLELYATKEKKTGGLLKGRKLLIYNLPYLRHDHHYVQEVDQEIIKLILAMNSQYSSQSITLTGTIGAFTLTKLLNTRRLYWQNGANPALRTGEVRELRFNWLASEQDGYQLSVTVQPTALLLLIDPPHYIDTEANTIGGLKPAMSVELLKKYLAAPIIPEADAEEFSRQLLVKKGNVLPTPKKIALTEINNVQLTPRLRLFGEATDNKHYSHIVALSFYYDQWQCSANSQEPYSIIKSKQGLLRIQRDLVAENVAIAFLHQQGFYPAVLKSSHEAELWLSHQASHAEETVRYWSEFLQTVLPTLQQDGWLIEIEDSFKFNFYTADAWDADISESHNDWFEMRFNVDINGQSYPLLPLILPVLENYPLHALPDILHLHLGDYRYLSVASATLKPILAVLMELFHSSHFNDHDGALRISRFNAASLAELEMHNYGLFSLKGGQQLRELAQKLKDFSGIKPVALPANFQAELRPYQQQGLNWLQFLREYQFGGILADDMGLGKTIQTLAHLLIEKQSGRMTSPCLIVAPTSLMSNWRREVERFTPDLSVLILQGIERKQLFDKIADHDLVLTTYPLLPRDEEQLLKYQYHYLVLDEAQTVKNPTAIAAQIARKINANHRLCLTGTPMENHLGELWAQFDFLMPYFLGDNHKFKKYYRVPIEQQGDYERKAQLSRRIAPFMLRRTKQAVVNELPEKTEIIRTVSLHPKQATLYESIRLTMEQRVRDAIAEKGLARSHITILDALLKLRQTCCDPRTLSLKTAQKIKESAKLDLLMEMLPEQLEEGRRILIFSQFTRMIALIEDELNAQNIAYSKLTGQTKKRDEAISLFKTGQVNVFLISLKAGGVGLNLTEADTVIIYDPWWNPAVENQATDRAYRIGQDKPVFVYKLVTENTVEEKILAMQDKKRALADSIYSDESKEESLLFTADDLTELFAPL